jgi:hypothetical protein
MPREVPVVTASAEPTPRAEDTFPAGAGSSAGRYFERFFGLCWFRVPTSTLAAEGTGTAP